MTTSKLRRATSHEYVAYPEATGGDRDGADGRGGGGNGMDSVVTGTDSRDCCCCGVEPENLSGEVLLAVYRPSS